MLWHWVRVAIGVAIAFVVALVAVLLLGKLLDHWVRANGSTAFDQPITDWAVDRRSSWLTSVMRQITRLGSSTVILPLTLLALAYLGFRRRWDLAGFVLLGLIGGLRLADLAKEAMDRARPPSRIALEPLLGLAFPSGHTTQATVTYLSLAVVATALWRPRSLRIAVFAGAIVIALLVGLSRLYLGVHWATDVIGGWFLGTVWITGLTIVLYRLHLNMPVLSAGEPEPLREKRSGARS